MTLIFNIFFVLLPISVFFIRKHATQQLDLNVFHQNDYKLKTLRMEIVRFNKNIMDLSVVTFKYNRTQPVINSTFIYKRDVRNKVVAVIQVYKFMSNEYRFFPIHFAVNGCEAMAADICGILTGLKRCRNFSGCPMLKGKTYQICNWYPDESRFPPYIPNGEYKIEVQALHDEEEMFVVDVYADVSRPIVYS